jgi:phospholipase C
MGYYDWNDLPYYYELAFQFATSDTWFSSVLANTIPNRMYMFAGTSFGHVRPATPPSGGWMQPTIFDRLDAAGMSWRYYKQDSTLYLTEWSTWQRDSGKVVSISNWYTDVKNESTLPEVIFIERGGTSGLDEHPLNNIQKGAANTKKILDALMQSPSWPSSVFILTYDEGGGLYDHVPPAGMPKPDSIAPMLKSTDLPGDFNQSGFRVPLIVISPWARPHFVSHTARDLTSILKLIEVRFGVKPLTARDGTADDMSEFFDFSSPHWLTPPPLPFQPTDGICNFNLEKAPGH